MIRLCQCSQRAVLVASLLLSCGLAFPEEPANWSQFRGPGARGVASNPNLPKKWSATENVEWKRDLPGRGWSCPVVWGKRIFLTTVINEGVSEKPKKGLYFGGERPKFPETVHRWKVYCLDLHSGAILWEREVHQGKPQTTRCPC